MYFRSQMTLLIAFLAKCFLNLEISDESVLVGGNSSIIGFGFEYA